MQKILSFLSVIVIIIIAVLYQKELLNVINNFFITQQEEKLENPVATLLEKENTVKYKRATKLVWEDSKTKMRFALMDSLSTKEKAKAIVDFDVGTMLKVSENSLVVIEYPPISEDYKITKLKMEDGILQVRNTKNTNLTIIKTGNLTTTARGIASVGLKVKNQKAEVWVDEGVATVSDKEGKEVVIKENEYKHFSTLKLEDEKEPVLAPKKIRRRARRTLKINTSKKKTLSTYQVRKIITRQRNKIDSCYQKRGVRNVKGLISLKILINNTGDVARLDILESTVRNAIVDRCVKLWIKATKFPRFEDQKSMTETIRFVFN